MKTTPRTKLAFCSDVNRARLPREPMLGTAHHVSGFVLITWPRRLWGKQHFKSRGLPDELVDELKRIQKEHRYFVRLVSSGALEEGVRIFLMPTGHVRRFRSIDDVLPALRETFSIQHEPPNTSCWTSHGQTLLLVCTNGARDRCCAKYGFGVFKEARSLQEAAHPGLEVLQCTHLTGDRFAACALVMPSGDLYGQLRPGNVAACLEDITLGRIHHPLFRGNSYKSELDQIMDGLLRYQLGDDPDSEAISWAVEESDNGLNVTVRRRGCARAIGQVQLVRRSYELTMDCTDLDQGKRVTFDRLVVSDASWSEET